MTSVAERVRAFLFALYPDHTVDNVAADLAPCGVKRATVAKMLERRTAPGAVLLFALIHAYGPDFLAAAYPAELGWLDAAARETRRAALEAQRDALARELERL